MVKFRYYVYHKVQIGKAGQVTEAGRLVKHQNKIEQIEDVQAICNALALSHGVQENHVMVVSWQYMGWELAIIETLKGWFFKAAEVLTREPQAK
jgi:hypothetical protein